jgi:isoquinoline 1-oxidoreductase beta subunit
MPAQATASRTSFDLTRRFLEAGAVAGAGLLIGFDLRHGRGVAEVPADEITVERGVVLHAPSNLRATFGELATKAAEVPPPTDVKLKDPKDWKLIDTHVPRVRSAAGSPSIRTWSGHRWRAGSGSASGRRC